MDDFSPDVLFVREISGQQAGFRKDVEDKVVRVAQVMSDGFHKRLMFLLDFLKLNHTV